MDALKSLIENLKEKIKNMWAEQQESEAFIRAKEKYETLSPTGQKGILAGIGLFIILVLFWWPVSNFLDSMDQNSRFEARRALLKDLMKIDRDLSSGPLTQLPPAPGAVKGQFDGKLVNAGIRPDQIKTQAELPAQEIMKGVNESGIQYQIDHLTIKQAVELAYEFEHTDQNFKLAGFEVLAEQADPHFYGATYKIVAFAPKVVASGGGKDIVDSIKKARTKAPKEDKDLE